MPSIVINIAANVLPTIIADMRSAIADIIRETAEEIRDADIQLVPVDTGTLRDSIRIEPQDDLHITVTEGNEEAFYGGYVEFGTRHQVAQPHFTPACEAAQRYFVREMSNLESRIK